MAEIVGATGYCLATATDPRRYFGGFLLGIPIHGNSPLRMQTWETMEALERERSSWPAKQRKALRDYHPERVTVTVEVTSPLVRYPDPNTAPKAPYGDEATHPETP